MKITRFDHVADDFLEAMAEGRDTLSLYQQYAIETWANRSEHEAALVMAIGLGGEAGELLNKVKKIVVHHSDKVTKDDVGEEIADCMWYLAVLAHHYGLDMNKLLLHNLARLRSKYQIDESGAVVSKQV